MANVVIFRIFFTLLQKARKIKEIHRYVLEVKIEKKSEKKFEQSLQYKRRNVYLSTHLNLHSVVTRLNP